MARTVLSLDFRDAINLCSLSPFICLLDPLMVKAARGDPVSRPPAWMMRQAGRYMAVYRKLAEKLPSFRERSETTDLIVEISLQPREAFRPDGVIIFSDILIPLPAFGVGDHAAVLGFVGAPWTIATYIVEGGTTRTYTNIKMESGAHCIQIFDSWGGQLPPDMWEKWSKPYITEIVSIVQNKCPRTPLVLYINGNGGLLERMKGTGADVIGLDWTVDMADGRKRLGCDIGVQGNVDPAYLFSSLTAVTGNSKFKLVHYVFRVVKCAGPRGHILNLGHGVLVGTPEEAVAHFFDVTKSLKYDSSSQNQDMEESKLFV
ncbi:Uroporphyrinogen decarboxylase 1 [Hibiscus syriacus]|uniref:Uroporphyrinogen decarboxylase 1 n=1 Tax=Hibiscus syriacus TaxID=106335 RepID=A0A6A3BD43_HIBSY|nr:Uroporphyrinogen decarboxylase 1 [Hibiscus syriacus]